MIYNEKLKTGIKTLTLILMVGLLAACSGIPVTHDYVPTTDFSGLNSYRWSADILQMEKETKGNNPLMNSRIHNAVDRNLVARGFQLGTDKKADFIVSYQVEVRQRLTSDGASSSVSFGFGSVGSFGAIGMSTGSNVRDEDEATLIIDILSAENNSLLWRGTSTRYVYPHSTPAELTELINAHVDAILVQFPPQKNK